MRRIPPEKAAEIVRKRLREETVPLICSELKLPKSTVYRYLNLSQDYADWRFIQELSVELNRNRAIWDECAQGFVELSDGARELAKLLRKYGALPEELMAKAILDAHWRRLRAWKRRAKD